MIRMGFWGSMAGCALRVLDAVNAMPAYRPIATSRAVNAALISSPVACDGLFGGALFPGYVQQVK
jgi:hypothetical protein